MGWNKWYENKKKWIQMNWDRMWWNVIKGHQIRSLAFEGTGMNAGKPVFNNDIAYESGKNSVIRYDKDHTV